MLQKFFMLCCFLLLDISNFFFFLMSRKGKENVPSFLTCVSVPLFSAAASDSKSPKQDGPVQFPKLFPFSLQREILRLVPPKHTTLSISQSCPYSTFHWDLNPINPSLPSLFQNICLVWVIFCQFSLVILPGMRILFPSESASCRNSHL